MDGGLVRRLCQTRGTHSRAAVGESIREVQDAAGAPRYPARQAPSILGATTAQEASGNSPIGVPSIDRATENLVKWSARGE